MCKFTAKYFLTLVFCFFSIVQASDNNVLAPNARLTLTPKPIGDYGAFSFFGELGEKTLRGSGTYGVNFTRCQRLKVSAEYLTQKLSYDFSSEDKKRWVSQYAVGGAYQYLLPRSIFQSLDLGASYSHAFHQHISANKAIAGSDGAATYFGPTFKLWKCAYLSAAANYDYVKYHRRLESPKLANGWGGSLNLIQQLPKDLSFTATSEFRRPYDFYEGTFGWEHQFQTWKVLCGLYGNYTNGKRSLPNVTSAGIELGIAFGGKNRHCCRTSTPKTQDQKPSWSDDCYARTFCDLSNWVMAPAVYEPVVLDIKDERTAVTSASSCTAPTSTTIPTQHYTLGLPVSIATSSYFQSSEPLTYSASGLPSNLSINSSTGLISGNVIAVQPPGGFTIMVTATSSCGSTSQTFTLINP